MSAQHTPGAWRHYTAGLTRNVPSVEWCVRHSTTGGVVDTPVKAIRRSSTGRMLVLLPGGAEQWFNSNGWVRGEPNAIRWLAFRAAIDKATGGAA